MSDQPSSEWATEKARETLSIIGGAGGWWEYAESKIAAALDEAEARGRAEVRQPEDLNYHMLIARAEHAEARLAAVKGERDEWLRNAEAWRDELAVAEAERDSLRSRLALATATVVTDSMGATIMPDATLTDAKVEVRDLLSERTVTEAQLAVAEGRIAALQEALRWTEEMMREWAGNNVLTPVGEDGWKRYLAALSPTPTPALDAVVRKAKAEVWMEAATMVKRGQYLEGTPMSAANWWESIASDMTVRAAELESPPRAGEEGTT